MAQHTLQSLYREHHTWLLRWTSARLGCAQSAQDLTHDTYLKVINNTALINIEHPRQYLVRIAKNLMVDSYRRKQLEDSYLASLSVLPEQYLPSAEEQAMIAESLIEINHMLLHLPEKARQAFFLRQLDGLGYKEIAQRLNISLSSVEKYVAKALATCGLYKLNNTTP